MTGSERQDHHRPHSLDPPLHQPHRAVCLFCEFFVVCDHDYSEIFCCVQVSQNLENLLACGAIEISGRLVCQKYLRPIHQRSGDTRRIGEYVQELRDLGVESKGGIEGLVEFPSEMDDRIVFLCWKLDEPEVLHWHELDEGFQDRQPLVVESRAGESIEGSSCDDSESSR